MWCLEVRRPQSLTGGAKVRIAELMRTMVSCPTDLLHMMKRSQQGKSNDRIFSVHVHMIVVICSLRVNRRGFSASSEVGVQYYPVARLARAQVVQRCVDL